MQTFKNLLALGFKLHLSHTMNKKSTNNWKPPTPLDKDVNLHTTYVLQSSESLDHARVFMCRFKQLLIKLVSVLRISTPLHLQRRSGYVILSEQPVYFRPEAKYSIIKTLSGASSRIRTRRRRVETFPFVQLTDRRICIHWSTERISKPYLQLWSQNQDLNLNLQNSVLH